MSFEGPSASHGKPIQPPPALPPRPNQSLPSSYAVLNPGYNQGFYGQYTGWRPNTYSNTYYPNYPGYYPYGQVQGGAPDSFLNNIGTQFESSSRPAFETIETVVHTVASVSQLLESTYGAILASFRSILSVLEQFGRMKNQFSNLFSAFAIMRVFRWIRNKLATVRSGQTAITAEAAESAWSTSVQNTSPGDSAPLRWPLLAYLAITFGAPYLTWKLLQSSEEDDMNKKNADTWSKGEGDRFIARALYDFAAGSSDELSFQSGENLIIAPKEKQPRIRGWLLAAIPNRGKGLVPANRIKIYERKTESRQNVDSASTPDIVESLSSGQNIFEDSFR